MTTLIVVLIFSLSANAQCKDYMISPNGDTLNCTDQQDMKQGKWVVHVDELRGEPGFEEEGVFVDDKKEGVWRKYDLQGDLIGMEFYRWGYKDGKQQYFSMYGDLIREESWKAVNPENPYDTVPVYDVNDDKKITMQVIKLEGHTLRHGIWHYYEPSTGRLVKTENYILDKLDDGSSKTAIAAGDQKKVVEKPDEVKEFEKKNSKKKTYKYRTGQTGN